MNLTFKRSNFQESGELERLLDLQNYVYKGRYVFDTDDFKYWYVDNPQCPAYSFSAYDGDKMVANVAFIPTTISVFGKVLHGIHSMGVVTHPSYQGRGIFSKLSELACQCAKEDGKDFAMAISNANSTPAFLKYLGFYLVSPLDVKWGWGMITHDESKSQVYKIYDLDTLSWRLRNPKYTRCNDVVSGKYGVKYGIKTFMGIVQPDFLDQIDIPVSANRLSPLNLYIGIGADLSKGHYFNFPKFIKHSPFNLIFRHFNDKIPQKIHKEDVFIQLLDFDVT